MSKKELKINGNINDISAMLISAVRYALGRKTYIVNWTCEFILNNKKPTILCRTIGLLLIYCSNF